MSRKRDFLDISEHTILWKISEPKQLFQTSYPGDFHFSNDLILGSNNWYLDIYPKGQFESKSKKKKAQTPEIALWLGLNQQKTKAGPVDVVNYEISILDKHGDAFDTEKSKGMETFNPKTSGLPENNGDLTDCRGWLDFHPTREIEKN